MLTLLTPTGARPKAFAFCEKMMQAQDYDGPVRWVIVDDGEEEQEVKFCREGWELCIIRPGYRWRSGLNTQAANLASGLAEISHSERVAVIEDDDCYLPGYLSAVNEWFSKADLVGESLARYYHVPRAVYREMDNKTHASLCSTAMQGTALQAFRDEVMRSHKFIDIELWKNYQGSKKLFRTHHVVGMKGLPGRDGIGAGHRMDGFRDSSREILEAWVGEYAFDYLAFSK